jgi:hypothetical protein
MLISFFMVFTRLLSLDRYDTYRGSVSILTLMGETSYREVKRLTIIRKPAKSGLFFTGGGHEMLGEPFPGLQKPIFQAHLSHFFPGFLGHLHFVWSNVWSVI